MAIVPEQSQAGRPLLKLIRVGGLHRDRVHEFDNGRLGHGRDGVAQDRRDGTVIETAPRGGDRRDDLAIRVQPDVLVLSGLANVHVDDSRVSEQCRQI
ncbi:hypothetical protein LUX33_33200 [Actinomadura madurae]|uniref:hypothetical protein n=1 Tax=Actinomadura madurae TaxID=1993 RepID=UPI0020D253D0|nr:hypothetical protein [Actinomadura madurae]MCP9952816.1 hypothetical protein [Actinomadura madurae]